MAKRDYYEVLGTDKTADEATLKKAYRSLAMKFHPDRNPGDKESVERMKEINEAYAVLSDSNKRRLYDTYGHAGLEGYTQDDIFGGVDFGSIFGDLFGGGFGDSIFDGLFGRRSSSRGRQRRRGADLRYDLRVTLEDAVFGKEETIEIPRVESCSACGGTGAKKNGFKDCDACRGTGQKVTEQRSGFGVVRQITTCGKCRGTGRFVLDPCTECDGKGRIEETRRISFRIPKGVDTGHRIRIEGEGQAGENGSGNGDLYIVMNLERHPVFERHGDDVYVAKEVEFPRAALGGEVDDIPGLERELKIEIPEGTQNGAVFRIANEGIPHLDNHGRGDEYVVIKVITPTDMSEKEKGLLREFQESRSRRSN